MSVLHDLCDEQIRLSKIRIVHFCQEPNSTDNYDHASQVSVLHCAKMFISQYFWSLLCAQALCGPICDLVDRNSDSHPVWAVPSPHQLSIKASMRLLIGDRI